MELFCITSPGLETLLAEEASENGFTVTGTQPGGVTLEGGAADVVRANRCLRGATRVLARLTSFRAMHLAQLDKRARKLEWAAWLRPDIPVRVEATCRKSRIYHHRAAAQRIETAIRETLGADIRKDADITIKVRIEDDLCTLSVDTSGTSLHKRGLKQQVNKAPMRETLAALFLRACAFTSEMPVYDPMCGSGTFPIEAAEVAAGLLPGRARSFAFEQLAGFDLPSETAGDRVDLTGPPRFFGSDRDAGAISMSRANADRAGVSALTQFDNKPVSDIIPPTTMPGLVIVNPPYGGRIGGRKNLLYGLYASFGDTMKSRFQGWKIGIITSEAGLAKATGLPFAPPGPVVDHGGTKIRLWTCSL